MAYTAENGVTYLKTWEWVDDRSPTEADGNVNGRVLVDDPLNSRIRLVRIFCVDHFPRWMRAPDMEE